MNPSGAESRIRKFFLAGIVLKGLNGLLEVVAGILLFFTAHATDLVSQLVQGELIEDPTDFLAAKISSLLPYVSVHSQLFAAYYLFGHGVVKIFLVWGLLKNKLWAYPTAM